jgi:hypothetical protein
MIRKMMIMWYMLVRCIRHLRLLRLIVLLWLNLAMYKLLNVLLSSKPLKCLRLVFMSLKTLTYYSISQSIICSKF